jgi:hypothetical protein
VAALSMNIFLPSLPSMAAYFGVDYALMQLSVSLYLGRRRCCRSSSARYPTASAAGP